MSSRAAGRDRTVVPVAASESIHEEAASAETEPVPQPPGPRITHQPALDGLRGIAVLCVLFFHNGRVPPLELSLPGGYLGVDVFLVLSGYLITALLLAEHESTGGIGLVAFWGRRARRLLPALFLTLLLIAAYCYFVASAAETDRIRGDVFATLLYVQNWRIASLNAAFGSPVSHTWSLSVEEQWYVLWPLIFAGMFVLFRRNRERIAIVVGLCALGLTAWTWFMQDSGASRGRMFYGTDTRITPVLVGATLAFMLARLHREEPVEVSAARSDWQPWLEAAGIAGAVWVGWFLLTSVPHDEFMYHGGYFLFAIATACLIAASLHPRSQVLRPILSWRVLGAVGVVSYGLYLYHLPVFYWITPAHVSLNGYAIVGLRIVVTATLAIASFVLVERRFRHAHFRPAVTWVLIATAAVVAVAAILVATSTKSDIVVVEPGSDPNPATLIALRRIGDGAPPGSTKLLVAGDGAAFGLGSAVRNRYEGDKVFGTTFADLQCGLAEGTLEVFGEAATNLPACRQWPDQYRAAVEAVRPDVVALMIGNREPFNRIIDGETVVFGSDEWKQQLRAELDRARAGLTASGAHLMLLTVPCPAGVEDSTLTSEQRSESRRHRINEELREYAAEHAPDVSIGDLGAMLCSPGGWKARTDNLHFTPAGARQTWAWLGEQARQAVRG